MVQERQQHQAASRFSEERGESTPRPFFDVGGRRRHRDFGLALDNVWYGHLALLFKMTVQTDSNELRDVECAMIDVLFDYAEGRC